MAPQRSPPVASISSDSSPSGGTPVIRVVAALIVDAAGRVLLVRKRGTVAFMQPGGKPEPGETAPAALARELHEELSLTLDPAAFVHLGRFETQAANEAGHDLVAEVFAVEVAGGIAIAAEIDEFAWVDLSSPGTIDVAPLTRDFMPPFIAERMSRTGA